MNGGGQQHPVLPYVQQLATATTKELGIQLAFGTSGATFVKLYEEHATSGYCQLPFSHQQGRLASTTLWAMAHRAGVPVGFGAARIVEPVPRGGLPLSDELRRGLLYAADATLGGGRGWLPGAGPTHITRGASLYLGGIWVHPCIRGRGVVAALSQLVACGLLHKRPDVQTVWALEEDVLLRSGAMTRAGGLGLFQRAKVFEGFFPIIGASRVMHAVWESSEDYLRAALSEAPTLEKLGRPTWLKPSSPEEA